MRRLLAVAGAAALLLAGGVPARATVPARAFTVQASGYPVDPAPGLNQTALGARPAATRATLSNPPATAYGRAAAYDLGTLELYTGPPPPETVAECDTGSDNVPDEATAAPGDIQLAARCSAAPAVEVRAAARSYESAGYKTGATTSRVTADGASDTVTTDGVVTVHDVSIGPLVIGSVVNRGSARANGQPGGADATGRVTATGATVNGTPVVIGPDGVEVDRERVPLEFVPTATAAVHDALAQGGYSDVRVAQPAVTVDDDGSHASVRGGGLSLFFTNNDPTENYFVRITFAGLALAVAIGGSFDGGGVVPPGPESPLATGGSTGGRVFGPGTAGSSPPLATPGAASDAGTPSRPALATGRRSYELPDPWRGWPVLLALGLGAAIGGWVARRRLLGWWNVNADRYLRG